MKDLTRIVDELEQEIVVRQDLFLECKGTYYPMVLKEKIGRLQQARHELMKNLKNLERIT